MKKLTYIYAIVLSLFSCTQEDYLATNLNGDQPMEEKNGVTVTEEGFLDFTSLESLKKTVADIEGGLELGLDKRAAITRALKDNQFESICYLREDLEGGDGGGYIPPVVDDEEMSIHEYRLMKAEELILDPILEEVMDTTLRVGVGDRIYKITEHGTFSAPKGQLATLEREIANFNTALVSSSEIGSSVSLNNGVIFVNSFGPTRVPVVETTPTYIGNFHEGYNCLSYKWQNNSLWQKFWDMVRGKDVTKEVNFDAKNRVKVEVFNVNYSFYASSGIKVKMQKRKKFLFVKYWVGQRASKIAIGFNKLHGEMRYTNPRSASKIAPTTSAQWGVFTGTLNGLVHNFLLGNYNKFDIVKDWADDIYTMVPQINIQFSPSLGYTFLNRDMVNKAFELPVDFIYNQVKGLAGKYVYTPVRKQIQPKDPRMAYFIWGEASCTFEKDNSYIMGVKEYENQESKTIRFDRSFGFNYNNGIVSGFTPTEFIIKDLDMFAACYFNGTWKGIRFTK